MERDTHTLRAPRGIRIGSSDWGARLLVSSASLIGRYHQHRVYHLSRLGKLLDEGRRIVLVGNHVLDTMDPFLFVATVVRRYGCAPRFIGHENIVFRMPGLKTIASRWRVIPSRRMDEAAEALEREGFLMLFPGAGTEAILRRYREQPYTLKWEGRLGFLKLALEHDAEILFVAAVGTEEMYYQSRIPTPDWLLSVLNAGDAERYHGAPLTFGLLGPHVLPGIFPFPVQVTHYVSRPLDLGDRDAARGDPEALLRLHGRVWGEAQAFLDRAVLRRHRHAPCGDRAIRGVQTILRRIGV
jgi:1-acyl-sn-glycerol-3-phosphate acyltransferase